MNRGTIAIANAVAALLFAMPGRSDGQRQGEPRDYAYHLRVVRVLGESPHRGAALGCERFCGKPIVLPSEEPWGTPDQLTALAHSLGGAEADAVSGYIVRAGDDGVARFEAIVYPGQTAVRLRFVAGAPATRGDPHDLRIEILTFEGEEPLAEARIVAATERTVSIAAPSPVEGEWIILSVTPIDAVAAEEHAAMGAPIAMIGDDVTRPELIEKVNPSYPRQARKERREGRIVLQAIIDIDGRVRALSVLRVPEGAEDLAAAAAAAVGQWRYQPALRQGVPVPVYFTMVVEFSIM